MRSTSSSSYTNLNQGLDGISHVTRQSVHAQPKTKPRMIFFTGDVIASHLSKLFKRFNSERFIRLICKPHDKEFQALHADHANQALQALNWCEQLDSSIDPMLKQNALRVLQQIAELHIQQQVQSKLLISA
ncbi:MAG: hypothetical protein HWE26_17685 [Alteromonadaceae bacterium]|nr:hypothetical protein [Alteromonadaceae bacterium]